MSHLHSVQRNSCLRYIPLITPAVKPGLTGVDTSLMIKRSALITCVALAAIALTFPTLPAATPFLATWLVIQTTGFLLDYWIAKRALLVKDTEVESTKKAPAPRTAFQPMEPAVQQSVEQEEKKEAKIVDQKAPEESQQTAAVSSTWVGETSQGTTEQPARDQALSPRQARQGLQAALNEKRAMNARSPERLAPASTAQHAKVPDLKEQLFEAIKGTDPQKVEGVLKKCYESKFHLAKEDQLSCWLLFGSREVANLLHKSKLKVEISDDDGYTPLLALIDDKRPAHYSFNPALTREERVRILLELGANKEATIHQDGTLKNSLALATDPKIRQLLESF